MANVWCVQNGVQGLRSYCGYGKVGAIVVGKSQSLLGARRNRGFCKLGLRIACTARPADMEAGNVEWLDIPKQGGVGGDEETTRDRKEQENLQKQGVQIAASKGSGVLDLPAQSDVDQRRREQQFASILQVRILTIGCFPLFTSMGNF